MGGERARVRRGHRGHRDVSGLPAAVEVPAADDRPDGARAPRHRAARDRDRRRKRRERVQRGGVRGGVACQRHRGEPHAGRERRGGADRPDARSLRGDRRRGGRSMLKLRRGMVVDTAPLTVQVGDERRPAWADPGLVGEVAQGDEVVINTEAADLGLGSGGFDVVHVNLTRGLTGRPAGGSHVMKLNYTSLQHSIDPVDLPRGSRDGEDRTAPPVLVLPLHGHLAPSVWAAGEARPGIRVGYVQTAGGSLPGALSRDVAELRERELLAGHITAGPAYGGEHEAVTTLGALDAAVRGLGWDAIACGPGPGIL